MNEEQTKNDTLAVMLAKTWRSGGPTTGWWISEKLDGMRAIWNGTDLLSRNGNRINAPDWFLAGLPAIALDGELWMGRGQFQETVAAVRWGTPDQWSLIHFRVFDAPEATGGFEARQALLASALRGRNEHIVALLPQTRCDGPEHLEQMFSGILNAGGEGVVLRRPGSAYEPRRSAAMLKRKRRGTCDAVVIDHLTNRGRVDGLISGLLCERPGGLQFRVGAGLPDAERRNPPPIGATVIVACEGFTDRGVPRCPSFGGVRVLQEIESGVMCDE